MADTAGFPTRGQIGALIDSVDRLTASIGNLATKEEVVEVERTQNFRRRVVVGLVAAGFAIMTTTLAVVIYVGLSVRDQSQSNGQVVERTAANARLLVECLTPSPADNTHECYERTVARDAVITSAFTLGLQDTIECSIAVPRDMIAACIAQRAAERAGAE